MTKDEFIAWEQASRDVIDVKRIYIDITGDLATGVLLSQIVFWSLPDRSGKQKLKILKDGRYWLAKKREDWWDECRITPKQFDRAIGVLEDKKLVVTDVLGFAGAPVKHVSLDFEELIRQIAAYLPLGNLPKGQYGYSPKVNMDIPQRSISNTERTTEITTESNNSLPKGSLKLSSTGIAGEAERLEDAAFSLFVDWREIVEKPNIQWDVKGGRAKNIIYQLKKGVPFDDIRLAVRGMLTNDFIVQHGWTDIKWVCEPSQESRIETYKQQAVAKRISADEPIRASNGYKKVSAPKKDFTREEI